MKSKARHWRFFQKHFPEKGNKGREPAWKGENRMNNREYFLTTSLSYQLQAARKELAAFRSGEAYRKLRADYEKIIRGLNITIKGLKRERFGFSFRTNPWSQTGLWK